jgi:hypothetical protein
MVLDGLRFEQKNFHLFLFSFLRVLVVRVHAFLYERKSVMEPVRRKILKSKNLSLTTSMQVEFHHGGEGGNIFVFGLLRRIVALADLYKILVKEE